MAVGEEERLELLNSLIKVHGEDAARKLMESLPPFPWNELATKDDLKALKEWTEAKFDAQSTAMAAQFTAVAAEFVSVRGELSKVEGNLTKEIGGLSKEIGGLSAKIADQTRILVLTFAGFALTVCAAMAGGILFA